MFRIEKNKPKDPEDIRGATYEWKFPDGQAITLLKRKKGSLLGGHYHPGKDPSKNPERFFVIQGKMKTTFIKGKTKKEVIVKEGDVLTIYPGVFHEMEVLEDIILVERRVTHFDPENPDTIPFRK